MRFDFENLRLPGLNEIINLAKTQRRKFSPYAARKREIDTYLICSIRSQLRQSDSAGFKIGPQSNFEFVWSCGDRRTDPDNRTAGQKFIFDALVAAEVLPNDGYQYVNSITHRFRYDVDWGVSVEISSCADPGFPPLRVDLRKRAH